MLIMCGQSTSKNLDHTWKFTKGHHKIFLDFVVGSKISVEFSKKLWQILRSISLTNFHQTSCYLLLCEKLEMKSRQVDSQHRYQIGTQLGQVYFFYKFKQIQNFISMYLPRGLKSMVPDLPQNKKKPSLFAIIKWFLGLYQFHKNFRFFLRKVYLILSLAYNILI